MRTFVVGDVHGHHDRLRALLFKAGAMTADERLEPGVEVVQLGDLGNFSLDTLHDDIETYTLARKLGITMLWGNHDRAAADPLHHAFRGFTTPPNRLYALLLAMQPKLALARNGYLLTHAGMSPVWARGWDEPMTADEVVARIYTTHGEYGQTMGGLIDQIGRRRGGVFSEGGLLWRDDDEPLWMGVPQVYGHTRGDIRGRVQRLEFDEHGGEVPIWSLCIDVGGHTNGSLAGVWLDTMKIVAVGPDAYEFESVKTEVSTK